MSMNDDSTAKPKFDIATYWVAIQGKWFKSDKPAAVASAKKRAGANFKSDLAKGQASEHDFYMKYQHCITRTDGRRGDMEINKCGSILELKSDYYDHDKTSNFFIERFSYDDKPGGVWQSAAAKVTYFIYWWPQTGQTYIFNVQQLLRKLNKLTKSMELVEVRNQGYVTRGYKVPRSALEHLCLTPESIGLYAK